MVMMVELQTCHGHDRESSRYTMVMKVELQTYHGGDSESSRHTMMMKERVADIQW